MILASIRVASRIASISFRVPVRARLSAIGFAAVGFAAIGAAAGCSSNPATSRRGGDVSPSPMGTDADAEAAAAGEASDASSGRPDTGAADANTTARDATDSSAAAVRADAADATAEAGPGPGPYTVGGTLTFVAGSGLVLRNSPDGGADAGETLAIASGMKSFAFATLWPTGAAYDVTIDQEPSMPNQTCTVSGGAGQVNGGPVTSVAVVCTTSTYTISGTVTGLGSATGLVLLGPNHDSLPVTADGPFSFPSALTDGSSYDVSVDQQPFGLTCEVQGGIGTIQGMDTQISVTCS